MSSKNPKLCTEMFGWIGWKQKNVGHKFENPLEMLQK
jgi:hypothetical protein